MNPPFSWGFERIILSGAFQRKAHSRHGFASAACL